MVTINPFFYNRVVFDINKAVIDKEVKKLLDFNNVEEKVTKVTIIPLDISVPDIEEIPEPSLPVPVVKTVPKKVSMRKQLQKLTKIKKKKEPVTKLPTTIEEDIIIGELIEKEKQKVAKTIVPPREAVTKREREEILEKLQEHEKKIKQEYEIASKISELEHKKALKEIEQKHELEKATLLAQMKLKEELEKREKVVIPPPIIVPTGPTKEEVAAVKKRKREEKEEVRKQQQELAKIERAKIDLEREQSAIELEKLKLEIERKKTEDVAQLAFERQNLALERQKFEAEKFALERQKFDAEKREFEEYKKKPVPVVTTPPISIIGEPSIIIKKEEVPSRLKLAPVRTLYAPVVTARPIKKVEIYIPEDLKSFTAQVAPLGGTEKALSILEKDINDWRGIVSKEPIWFTNWKIKPELIEEYGARFIVTVIRTKTLISQTKLDSFVKYAKGKSDKEVDAKWSVTIGDVTSGNVVYDIAREIISSLKERMIS